MLERWSIGFCMAVGSDGLLSSLVSHLKLMDRMGYGLLKQILPGSLAANAVSTMYRHITYIGMRLAYLNLNFIFNFSCIAKYQVCQQLSIIFVS